MKKILNKERCIKRLDNEIRYLSKLYVIDGYGDDDIAQELRLALWVGFDSFDPHKSRYKTFASRIMRHRLLDLLKKRTLPTVPLNIDE